MDEAKARSIKLLNRAEKLVQMPEFKSKDVSTKWILDNVGDLTFREFDAVRAILNILDGLDD